MPYHPEQGDALIDVVEEMDQVDKRLDDAFQAEERFYVFLEMLVVLVRGCFRCCVPQATVWVSRHDTRCCGAPLTPQAGERGRAAAEGRFQEFLHWCETEFRKDGDIAAYIRKQVRTPDGHADCTGLNPMLMPPPPSIASNQKLAILTRNLDELTLSRVLMWSRRPATKSRFRRMLRLRVG